MSLVISDTHGDLMKLKAFSRYRPDTEHIIAGDIFDAWEYISDTELIASIRYALDPKNKFVLILGNHEAQYLEDPPFSCSGKRLNSLYTKLCRENQHKFCFALNRDNVLITHAGVTANFEKLTISQTVEYLEDIWNAYLELSGHKRISYVAELRDTKNDIFGCSARSGGTSKLDGPLWARPARVLETIQYSTKFSQCFGHTERSEPTIEYINKDLDILHANTDTKKWCCFNTESLKFEFFGNYTSAQIVEMERITKIADYT